MNARNVRALALWLSIGKDIDAMRWEERGRARAKRKWSARDSERVIRVRNKNGDVYSDREMNGKTYT